MRHARYKLIGPVAVLLCLAVPALTQGQIIAGSSTIVNSPHNLNNEGVALPQSQICLPCHTPHNAPFMSSTANGQAPQIGLLWNHQVNFSKSYTMYTQVYSTRFGATSSANPVLDTTSRLCLSCHDDAIAVDSYGGNTGNVKMDQLTDSNGVVGGAAIATSSGNDLSNDHPVGVGYPGVTASTVAGVTTLSFNSSTGGGYNNPTLTTFSSGGVGGAAVSLAALPNGNYGVGCGTCHTPHNYTYNFLRMSNSGSALCLKCHNK